MSHAGGSGVQYRATDKSSSPPLSEQNRLFQNHSPICSFLGIPRTLKMLLMPIAFSAPQICVSVSQVGLGQVVKTA